MKIICIGLNYRKHAMEMGWTIPEEPVVFLKPDSSILKNNKPFFLPGFSENIHYEVEVVIKISKLGKSISAKFAPRYFDEVTVGIDITARDLQSRLATKRNALGTIKMLRWRRTSRTVYPGQQRERYEKPRFQA